MATSDNTRAQIRLELAIDAERAKLRQAHAVQRCLYEVLLYADGDDAVLYAEVSHAVATLIADALDKLDPLNLRRVSSE